MSETDERPDAAQFKPYFTAIGQVANAYSQLEFSINDAIWQLANVARQVGVCMTAQMIGPGPRNRCLLALLQIRKAPQSIIDEFNTLSKRIEGVAAARNRYVHDPIVINQDNGEIMRMEATADKSIRYGFMGAEIQGMMKLALKIDTAAHDFNQLYLRAVAELPAWPQTQFEQSEGIEIHRRGRKSDVTELTPPLPASGE
jgi:hypothetical protein